MPSSSKPLILLMPSNNPLVICQIPGKFYVREKDFVRVQEYQNDLVEKLVYRNPRHKLWNQNGCNWHDMGKHRRRNNANGRRYCRRRSRLSWQNDRGT
jgi:hypothetical protein